MLKQYPTISCFTNRADPIYFCLELQSFISQPSTTFVCCKHTLSFCYYPINYTMPSLPIVLVFLFASISRVKAHRLYELDPTGTNNTSSRLASRESPPEIPPKPPTSGPGSFHGSQFVFLEETGYAPAVDAMPVWVYTRTQKEFVRDPRFHHRIYCPYLLTQIS